MPNVSSLNRPPRYRRHKATGQAIVTVAGRDHYLGKHGSAASREAYRRLIAGWIEGDGRPSAPIHEASVAELILAYIKFARSYYRKDGKQTNEVRMIQAAAKIVRELYGRTRAADFGPLALKGCRSEMVRKDWCRTHTNKQTDRIKRMFKWAASEEIVSGEVYQSLRCVTGLKRGRTNAREGRKVEPVSDADLWATVEHLPEVVADMVQLQRFTGARPGEICDMRPCEINRAADPWEYVPGSHKTEHHGRDRVIFIGPKAQAILMPYLLRAPDSYCFSPAECDARRRAKQHENRRTPKSCGNRPGTNVRTRPMRKPGEKYTNVSYWRAIARAAEAAGVEQWNPHRLRHSFATEVRKSHGLEAVQVLLGHSKADVTQVYAERDFALAANVARQIG